MISGLSLLTSRAALPTASPGTAGTPGFADVLSAADPHPQAPVATPQRPVATAPGAPQAPGAPAGSATPKPPAASPAPTPEGRAEPSPTAGKPLTAQPPPARAASTAPARHASTAAAETQPDGEPAVLSTPALPTDEGSSTAAAVADPPPGLQALLATLQPATEPAPTLAWGAWAAGQNTAGAAGEEPRVGHGAVRGRIHPTPDAATTMVAATAADEATAQGPTLLNSLAEASTAATSLPAAIAEIPASALPGPGLNLPQQSALAAGAAPVTGTLPTAQAQIAASPGSPAFAPELGAQISTFVRQGVERAQLQLHPAEMGPVTVQILIEGAAAQVRLWAEQPGTRTALEQAMPTLAGHLRESGLTLTGGGVFEQASQSPEQAWREARQNTPQASGNTAELAGSALAAPARRRGVVDLIA